MNSSDMHDEDRRRLIKGTFSLTVSVMLVKILGFVYKVPLSYILTDEGMGYFNSAYTVFSFFYLLCSSGIPKAITITVGESLIGRGDLGEREILLVSLRIFGAAGLIVSAIMAALSHPIACLIGNENAALSILVISPSVLFVTISGVIRGYLNGVQNYLPIAVGGVIEGVVKFALGIVLVVVTSRCGAEKYTVAAAGVLGVSIASLTCAVYMLGKAKNSKTNEKTEQNIKRTADHNVVIRKIIVTATPITAAAAVSGASSVIDLFIVMRRLSETGASRAQAVALYGNYTTMAVPMLNLSLALITPLITASVPLFTKAHLLSDEEGMRRSVRSVSRAVSFFCAPLSFFLFCFPEQVLMLIFDDAAAGIAAPSLCALAPSVFLLGALTLINTMLESTGHAVAPLFSMCIGVVVKLVLSYSLIGKVDVGVVGAAIATSAAYLVSFVVSLIYFAARGRADGLLSLLPPLVCSALALTLSRIFYARISACRPYAAPFILSAALSVLLYLVFSGALWFIGALYDEKSKNIQKLSNLIG